MSESNDKALNTTEIKALIANNKLPKAIDALLFFTEQEGLAGLYNQVIIQSGRYKKTKTEQNQGSVNYGDLARTQININLALLDIIDQLPKKAQEEEHKKKKLPGISLTSFKKQIFRLLVGGKVIIFLYLLTVWESGGLTFDGWIGTMGIIFPVFAAYIALAFQDSLDRRLETVIKNKIRISRSILRTAYGLFFIYYAAFFLILYLQATGAIPKPGSSENNSIPSYKNFYGLLALVESYIGVYLGRLISTIFAKQS